MLTFLRKIRKSLIESGSTRKYLLYAVGEILFVMIGILLALQVNNWNEWRKERVKERQVLVEIVQTLESNEDNLRIGINQLEKTNSSSTIVLSFLNESLPYSDTLSFHFFRSGWQNKGVYAALSRAGYESLKSLGLEIIKNDDLKNEVISLFDIQIPRLSIFSEMGIDDMSSSREYIKKNFRSNGTGLLPLNHTEILEDNYYHSIVQNRWASRDVLIQRTQKCVEEIERVLRLIKEELGEE